MCGIDSRLDWPSSMIVSFRGRNEPNHHLSATSPGVARQIVKFDSRILENGRGRLLAEGLEVVLLNIAINQGRMRGGFGGTWWQRPFD